MGTIKKIFSFLRNERIRSLVFLGCWALFIGTLIVKFVIPLQKNQALDNNTTVINEMEKDYGVDVKLENMKKSLQNHVFNYKYTVLHNGQKIIYRGTMFMEETIGIKESVNGLDKYYVNEGQIYSMIFDEKTILNNQTKEIYNNYLSISYIMDFIADKEYKYNDREYNFKINNTYVKIIVGEDNISQIEIKEDENSYLLEFSNVNEITALNY